MTTLRIRSAGIQARCAGDRLRARRARSRGELREKAGKAFVYLPPLAGLLGQFGVPALSAFVNLDGSDPAVLGAVIHAKRKRAAQHMILDLAENFLFLATVLGACAFGVAWLARDAAHRRLALLPPARLTRLYAGALVGPPLAAAWVVCAAMLPTCWLGEHDF